jgi:hypothetical protein
MSGEKPRHRRDGKDGESDREQYQRFLDAAREHGCEENVGRLDEVVRRVAKLPPQGKEPLKIGKRKGAGRVR